MAKPVLLLHSTFTGAWEWEHVISELTSRGVTATALDLTSRRADGSFEQDVDAVKAALKELGEPAVLVGHSYSGAVITQASADNDDVAALVYVCAALPDQDESLGALMGRDPEPGIVGNYMVPADDGTVSVTEEGARVAIYNDATEEQLASVVGKLGSHAMSTFGAPVTALGYKQHPTTYVLTLQDKAFSPAFQRQMAAHATTVVEVDAGHGPTLTKPAEVANAIATAAG